MDTNAKQSDISHYIPVIRILHPLLDTNGCVTEEALDEAIRNSFNMDYRTAARNIGQRRRFLSRFGLMEPSEDGENFRMTERALALLNGVESSEQDAPAQPPRTATALCDADVSILMEAWTAVDGKPIPFGNVSVVAKRMKDNAGAAFPEVLARAAEDGFYAILHAKPKRYEWQTAMHQRMLEHRAVNREEYERPVGELNAASSDWERLLLLCWLFAGRAFRRREDLTETVAQEVGLADRFALTAFVDRCVEFANDSLATKLFGNVDFCVFTPRVFELVFPSKESAAVIEAFTREVHEDIVKASTEVGVVPPQAPQPPELERLAEQVEYLKTEEEDIRRELAETEQQIQAVCAALWELLKRVQRYVSPLLWQEVEQAFGHAGTPADPTLLDAGDMVLMDEYDELLAHAETLRSQLALAVQTQQVLSAELDRSVHAMVSKVTTVVLPKNTSDQT